MNSAQRSSVTLAETLDYPHIGYREGSTLFALVTSQVEELGRTLSMRVQLSSYEAICRMIESGVGIGIIPASRRRALSSYRADSYRTS